MTNAILMMFLLFIASCAEAPSLNRIYHVDLTINQRWDAPEYCSKLLGKDVISCAMPYTSKGCQVYLTPDADLEVLGHEVKHCYAGDFHRGGALQGTIQ